MKLKRLLLVVAAGGAVVAVAATVSASSPFPIGEDFDGVTAPALPANWAASQGTNLAGAPLWVTSATLPDAGTNDAVSIDATDVLDNRLDSPSFTGSTNTAVLTFRNNYNFESGFDGAVLEISINGGAFNDIIAAGGSWPANGNGYSGTISANFGSPIATRSAWTGNSSGYITTSVILPSAANGAAVKLRWRLGSDNSYSGSGAVWRVDTIGFCPTGLIPCLEFDISNSAAFASYKTVLNNQLYNALNYFNAGNTATGCSTMNSFKSLDTTYSGSPGTTGISVAMATAWNARADIVRVSHSCT